MNNTIAFRTVLTGVMLSVLIPTFALSADFYIDPENGSAAGDGSESNPWASLQQVLDDGLVQSQEWESLPPETGTPLVVKNAGAPVQAGDTIWLMTGDYGALDVTGFYNTALITVAAVEGETPRFSNLLIRACSNWRFEGLHISPENAAVYDPVTMIDIDSHDWQGPVHDIEIVGCTLQSVADISAWTIDDWNNLPANGINADGVNITIQNNYLKNVNFGISVGASDSLIMGNTVENFAGDGMRGLGNYTVFAYNTVKNCYDVNDNHDDGFQSWSVGDDGVGTGEVVGIVLRGNTIINYEDPNQPFRGPLQGLGCFDGTFVDWVVENNVVYTDHWHGISLYGCRNCTVVNNTVLDPNQEDPGPPWIMVTEHKDGTSPENCIVANNLTTALANSDVVTEAGNMIIDDPSTLFVDVDTYNFHLLQECAAVDAGLAEYAPQIDKDGIVRPQGTGVDVGAYEWHEADVQPVDDTDLEVVDTDTDDNSGVIDDDDNTATEGCGCAIVGNPIVGALRIIYLLFL
ncbi:MAG: right-handed parallel beta-helix repeat-containing protein [Deltaproteobacteria bacterium]|nr:right-handed parallel beta-helix repeat-containing protein [Deltaproteobacteria bacterium]